MRKIIQIILKTSSRRKYCFTKWAEVKNQTNHIRNTNCIILHSGFYNCHDMYYFLNFINTHVYLWTFCSGQERCSGLVKSWRDLVTINKTTCTLYMLRLRYISLLIRDSWSSTCTINAENNAYNYSDCINRTRPNVTLKRESILYVHTSRPEHAISIADSCRFNRVKWADFLTLAYQSNRYWIKPRIKYQFNIQIKKLFSSLTFFPSHNYIKIITISLH